MSQNYGNKENMKINGMKPSREIWEGNGDTFYLPNSSKVSLPGLKVICSDLMKDQDILQAFFTPVPNDFQT